MVEYNWWKDPKNKEEVERISWWNKEENKDFFMMPISVVNDGKYWVATFSKETEKILGRELHACAQGNTREDAIRKMFTMVRFNHEYSEHCRRKYQRWVPFEMGPWKHIGGKWFCIFGVHFNFRYGKNMKRGWYIPFTKLNISVSNFWKHYKKNTKIYF